MPERFPPIARVRARGAFASDAGLVRSYDEQAVGFVADEAGAFAGIVRGMAHARSARPVAHHILDLCTRIFRERTASMLDDLAELWWSAEHEGARVRPFASLPIGDRADLRARVKRLLTERVADALGDQAVLEGETKRLLDLPEVALRRANGDIERKVERDRAQWAGSGGAAMCAIFAAGQASIAHLGDCRAMRLCRGQLDVLTREHTLQREAEDLKQPMPDYADAGRIITRAVGLLGRGPDRVIVPVAKGDLFLLATRGFYEVFPNDAIRAELRATGIEAAKRLVDRGSTTAQENLAAVAVQIV